MKTPIQQLIDEINRQRCLLIEKQFEVQMRLEDIRWQNLYDGMIKSLDDVESMLIRGYLQKEKEVIQQAYTDGIYEGCPIEEEDSTWQEWGSDYYNKTFNTKEK